MMMQPEEKHSSSTRRRRSSEEISSLVLQWQKSGHGRKDFARQHGVNHNTFSKWVKQNEQVPPEKRNKSSFLEVTLPAPSCMPVIELVYNSGIKLVFFSSPSVSLLKELLEP